jgi:DNA-binding beta-propeller fold protein YncE
MAWRRFLSMAAMALTFITGGHEPLDAKTVRKELTFTKLWTHGHTTPGQLSEIAAFDRRTNTIWVAGTVGVDVLDAATGSLITHIDVTAHGAVNSVAIHKGLAAFAVEAESESPACPSCDRRNPGKVLFYDTLTRSPSGRVNEIAVGSLPDMLTFTHDGRKLLVANEGTPNVRADVPYGDTDPAGSVTIIDVKRRTVVATAVFNGIPTSGENLRSPVSTGMDYEPEYIAINEDDTKAFVTLQEANGLAILDLISHEFTEVIGLGAKDFSQPGNEIDPRDDSPASVAFDTHAAKGLYMPDGIATYTWRGDTYLVMANEGDFREDNADRSAASDFGADFPLDRLRVSNRDSSDGNLYAAGARSFSIRRTDGELVYDSGNILDREAHARLVYDDGRSRDKGVEPEGVAVRKIGSRTFAFVGLERATTAAVAIFDITDLNAVTFVDMIVTPGDLSPEGLAAYKYRGNYYLAIANEVPAQPGATSNTTLYRLERLRAKGEPDDEDDESDD